VFWFVRHCIQSTYIELLMYYSRFVSWLWLLVIGCLINAFTVVQAQPLPERRNLTGRIMGGDGKPIVGATVTLRRENDLGGYAFWGALTVTDAQGNFSFPDAEEDSYFISAEATGYAPLQDKAFVLDANAKSWQVTLQRLVEVRMQFVKPDGSPLVSSWLSVRLERPELFGQPLRRQTDAKGTLILKEQRPGRYRIQAVAPGAGYAILPDANLQYAPTPPTVVVHLQKGGALRVVAQEEGTSKALGGAMLTLGQPAQISPEDRAAGRLARPEDMNLQALYGGTGDAGGPVTRDGDGGLELKDLPPGRYSVRLLAPGYAPPAWQEVELKASETSTVEFRFASRRAQASLEVLLRDDKQQPVANSDWNIQLRLLSNPQAPEVAPPPAPGVEVNDEALMNPIPGVLFRRVRTDEQGRVTLYPLPPGKWRVLVFPSRDSAPQNRGAVYQRDVEVPATGANITINVTPPKP
jgi:hypothetical protein